MIQRVVLRIVQVVRNRHRNRRIFFKMNSTSSSSTSTSNSTIPYYEPPFKAPILSSNDPKSLEQAALILRQGGLVAFPTETVYGLAASAFQSLAVSKIYKAKGRPSDNPLIVHISNRKMLLDLLPEGDEEQWIPKMYEPLMKKFWPGSLTLIFKLPLSTSTTITTTTSTETSSSLSTTTTTTKPSSSSSSSSSNRFISKIAPEVTGLQPTSLAIRMPSHPLALSLITLTGEPLAAPSANKSSRPSPTKVEHVVEDLGQGCGLGAILDGGDCQIGVESTVVDYHIDDHHDDGGKGSGEGRIRILRAGGVTVEQIEECLKEAGYKFHREKKVSKGVVVGGKQQSTNSNDNGSQKERAGGGVQVYARDFKNQSMEDKPTTPGMKYKHYAPSHSKVLLVRLKHLTSSSSSLTTTTTLMEMKLKQLIEKELKESLSRSIPKSYTIGLMFSTESMGVLNPVSTRSLYENGSLIELGNDKDDSSIIFKENKEKIDLKYYSYPIGSNSNPIEAGQSLFAGLRYLDSLNTCNESSTTTTTTNDKVEKEGRGNKGVDLILIEAMEENGVGLAVMERARKSAGGREIIDLII